MENSYEKLDGKIGRKKLDEKKQDGKIGREKLDEKKQDEKIGRKKWIKNWTKKLDEQTNARFI